MLFTKSQHSFTSHDTKFNQLQRLHLISSNFMPLRPSINISAIWSFIISTLMSLSHHCNFCSNPSVVNFWNLRSASADKFFLSSRIPPACWSVLAVVNQRARHRICVLRGPGVRRIRQFHLQFSLLFLHFFCLLRRIRLSIFRLAVTCCKIFIF
jgi:hypothetical protein